MILTLLRLLPVLLLSGWQVSWAESAPVTPQQAVSPVAPADTSPEAMLNEMQSAPARGLFYQISNKGQKAYLFGTLHVGKPDFFPLDRATTQALAESSELAVELDTTQTAKIMAAAQRYATLPPPQTLDALLPPALAKRLHTQLDALGIPQAAVQGNKPWMAALSLTMVAYQQSGYGFEYASDLHLTALAQGFNKPITELEGIDYQLQLFDSIAPKDQLIFLDETLRYLEQGQMPTDIQSIISAWLSGDADALHRISLKSLRDTPRFGKWVKQKLITERNLSMAHTIEQRLAQGHTPFVAVGAMHLVGKDGLPELFKKKGYRVVNLYKGSPQASR
ncbi:MAG: TraB/GumN family protein [Thiobacillus sp.]|nr:TraB/GumN family protein [Thiobacillus sp.]